MTAIRRLLVWGCFSAVLLLHCVLPAAAATIRFQVGNGAGQKMPCRIHLRNQDGEVVKTEDYPFWHDHFVCDGSASVNVPAGGYSWEIERGPEYRRATGKVTLAADETSDVSLQLRRITQLREEGWYSGDLHVHRSAADIRLLLMAEDLDFAPVIDWWNGPAEDAKPVPKTDFRVDGHRIYSIRAGEDEREGGALLYFGLDRPLDLRVQSREIPSPMEFVKQARDLNPSVWIDIEKPFWWDVPTWLASGKMNSIGLANNHMNRSQMYLSEAWGRPRDVRRLPNPRGNGFWTQEIYYHILNAGLRIPPSAGSASGVLKNPVGYNRVYVYTGDGELTRERWFEALSAGRCFVTNGPLLRVRADRHPPGRVLKLPNGGTKSVRLEIHLASRDRLGDVELIYNGRTVSRIACGTATSQQLSAELRLTEPGWFLVRTVADVEKTFRFASTAPWYVESDSKDPRISRRSVRFFLDWIDERIDRIRRNVRDPDQLRAVLEPHEAARLFWLERLQRANADLDDNADSEIEATSELIR